jgi:lysophospholipase L1-like esterase
MTFDLNRGAVVLVIGNSLTAIDQAAHQYRMLQPLIEESDRVYLGSGRSDGARAPAWITTSLSGMRWDNIVGLLPADLASYSPTHVILECGTNEVTTLRATTQASLTAVAAMVQGLQVMVIGPYAYGEKWPSGENDGTGASNDQRLDETADDIAAIFVPAVSGCTYVDFRSTLYEVTLPTLNLPAPGTYIGPYTIDGVHLSPAGRAAMWPHIRNVVRFR